MFEDLSKEVLNDKLLCILKNPDLRSKIIKDFARIYLNKLNICFTPCYKTNILIQHSYEECEYTKYIQIIYRFFFLGEGTDQIKFLSYFGVLCIARRLHVVTYFVIMR